MHVIKSYVAGAHFLQGHKGTVGDPSEHDVQALLPPGSRVDPCIVHQQVHFAQVGFSKIPEQIPFGLFRYIAPEMKYKLIQL